MTPEQQHTKQIARRGRPLPLQGKAKVFVKNSKTLLVVHFGARTPEHISSVHTKKNITRGNGMEMSDSRPSHPSNHRIMSEHDQTFYTIDRYILAIQTKYPQPANPIMACALDATAVQSFSATSDQKADKEPHIVCTYYVFTGNTVVSSKQNNSGNERIRAAFKPPCALLATHLRKQW